MSGQMQAVSNRIQRDIDHTTCPLTPPVDPDWGAGYLQYIEGPQSDSDGLALVGQGQFATNLDVDNNGAADALAAQGDRDDVLALTIKSSGEPFKGTMWFPVTPSVPVLINIESQTAEVVWWVATYDANNNGVADPLESRMLLRRVLLVQPTPADAFAQTTTGLTYGQVVTPWRYNVASFLDTDASAIDDPGLPAPLALGVNTLSDLSSPLNRALGLTFQQFPTLIPPDDRNPPDDPTTPADDTTADTVWDMGEFGEFVVLSDLLAFDIRVYDSQAPLLVVNAASNVAIGPGDPLYLNPDAPSQTNLRGLPDIRQAILNVNPTTGQPVNANAPYIVGRGAFVDLGYAVQRSTALAPRTAPWITSRM